MNDLAAQILGVGQMALMSGYIVFLRVGTAMALLPAFGERSVPAQIRLMLGLAFTVIVLPAVAGDVAPIAAPAEVIGIFVVTEVIAGLVIGIGLRLFVLALQTAGAIAAQSTSLSQLFGGGAADPQPAIGHLMLVAGLALAVITGLHVRIAEMFILSYDVLRPGQFIHAGMLNEWGVAQIARAFALAFSLAAPFVIASLIYNVALGVINRAMPQLMVAFVGAPAITAGGLMLLFLALPILLGIWADALNLFIADPFGVR